jgi:hypothetical protein
MALSKVSALKNPAEVRETSLGFGVTGAMIHTRRVAQEHIEACEALVERQRILMDELRVLGHGPIADRGERLLEQLVALKDAQIDYLQRLTATLENQVPANEPPPHSLQPLRTNVALRP